jgi:hypothetical protein
MRACIPVRIIGRPRAPPAMPASTQFLRYLRPVACVGAWSAAWACALAATVTSVDAAADTERVAFAGGADVGTAIVQGQLRPARSVDYRVHGGAGQTLSIVMSASHLGVQFDVNPPDSEQPMFVGQRSGRRFEGVLPADGDYTLRVYLPRASAGAQGEETAIYALQVGVAGRAVAPLDAGRDAVIPGTGFHAMGTVACSHYLKTAVHECRAYVTRRNGDGNATVEVRWPDGARRRVLFLGGLPVADDAAEPMSVQHVGAVCQLRFGDVERVEIPETLVRGG